MPRHIDNEYQMTFNEQTTAVLVGTFLRSLALLSSVLLLFFRYVCFHFLYCMLDAPPNLIPSSPPSTAPTMLPQSFTTIEKMKAMENGTTVSILFLHLR